MKLQNNISNDVYNCNILDYKKQIVWKNPSVKSNKVLYNLEYIENCFYTVKDNKIKFNNLFSNLLHASETLLFEKIYKPESNKSKVQNLIDRLCFQYEKFNTNRNFHIKIAFTTTNSKNVVQNLINSAITELDKSKFNYKSKKPIIEFLIIENSTEREIINNNFEYCKNLKNNMIKINYIDCKKNTDPLQEPLQIAQSRTFLINKINSLYWKASYNQPIWILDDDFEFTTTIPSINYQTENVRLGSIFHRLECIAKENKLDAIVGGNSGSPPIPELSTIKLQIQDLKATLNQNLQPVSWENVLQKIQQNSDYYYDLTRVNIEYFPIIQKIPNNKTKLNFTEQFLQKLMTGIPASRYLFANYNSNDKYNSAWYLCDSTAVSGGNTIYFNPNLLNSRTYWAVEYKKLTSRRADAVWFLLNKQIGFKILKMNFPLTHARTKRINKDCDINHLINNSLRDILGVALWEVVKENKYSKLKEINKNNLYKKIEKRLVKFENNLLETKKVLKEIVIIFPEIKKLDIYKLFVEILDYKILIDYNQIKLKLGNDE